MRLVQLHVASGRRDATLAVLEDEGIDHVLLDQSDGDELVQFPIPTGAVDHVLSGLTEAGIDGDKYTVVTSFAFAWTIRTVGIVPTTVEVTAIEHVGERIAPGSLTTIVGIFAGAAGARARDRAAGLARRRDDRGNERKAFRIGPPIRPHERYAPGRDLHQGGLSVL